MKYIISLLFVLSIFIIIGILVYVLINEKNENLKVTVITKVFPVIFAAFLLFVFDILKEDNTESITIDCGFLLNEKNGKAFPYHTIIFPEFKVSDLNTIISKLTNDVGFESNKILDKEDLFQAIFVIWYMKNYLSSWQDADKEFIGFDKESIGYGGISNTSKEIGITSFFINDVFPEIAKKCDLLYFGDSLHFPKNTKIKLVNNQDDVRIKLQHSNFEIDYIFKPFPSFGLSIGLNSKAKHAQILNSHLPQNSSPQNWKLFFFNLKVSVKYSRLYLWSNKTYEIKKWVNDMLLKIEKDFSWNENRQLYQKIESKK